MSIEIAIGILTVSGREKYLNKTLSMLNENLVVFKDIKPLMRAHVYALRALQRKQAEYILLFQDDIICARNLIPAVKLVLQMLTPPVLTLYNAKKQVVAKEGIFSFSPKQFLGHLAVAIKHNVLQKYLAYLASFDFLQDLKDPRDVIHSDVLLQSFMIRYKIRPYIVSPCLVQHIGKKSTVGHPWLVAGRPRQTPNFLGCDMDAYAYVYDLLVSNRRSNQC